MRRGRTHRTCGCGSGVHCRSRANRAVAHDHPRCRQLGLGTRVQLGETIEHIGRRLVVGELPVHTGPMESAEVVTRPATLHVRRHGEVQEDLLHQLEVERLASDLHFLEADRTFLFIDRLGQCVPLMMNGPQGSGRWRQYRILESSTSYMRSGVGMASMRRPFSIVVANARATASLYLS
jgi:hypothetical protein